MVSNSTQFMNTRTLRFPLAVSAALMLLAANSHAHPGHVHESGGIGWGLVHPFTGLDHLLAAFAVGMLAVLWRRASIAVVFLGAGILGGFAGARLGAFIGLESLLALSAVIFGVAVALHKHFARAVVPLIVALGATAHGWAHGSEAAGLMNMSGIFLGTAAIVAVGAAVAFALRHAPRIVVGFGATIAVAAFAVLVAAA